MVLPGAASLLAIRYSLYSLSTRPLQRGFEPVVAPEQFPILGGKARRPEHAEPLSLLGLYVQPRLVCIRSGRGEHGRRIDLQSRKHVVEDAVVVDPAAVTELRAEYGDAKGLAPALIERDQCDPRRQQAVLWKGIGATERHIQVRAQPLEVAPHVAALLRIEIERRRGPALCLEDRPEQERPKAHAHVGARGHGPDPRRRRIGVGRGEIEPEIERGRHGVMLEHDPEKWVPVFGKDHAPPKGLNAGGDGKASASPRFAGSGGGDMPEWSKSDGQFHPPPSRKARACARAGA